MGLLYNPLKSRITPTPDTRMERVSQEGDRQPHSMGPTGFERQTISFGGSHGSASLPFSSPLGLNGTTSHAPVETPEELRGRRLTFDLETVLAKIPPQFVASGDHDTNRHLHFSIEDLIDGIAQGAPAVRLSVLAEQCPEIIRSEIASENDTPVPLPLAELVEQIGAFPSPRGQKPAPAIDGNPIVAGRDRRIATENVSKAPGSVSCHAAGSDDPLGLAEIAALIAKFPSIRGCIVQTGEYSAQAGEIPGHVELEALQDAPSDLFDPVGRFAARLRVGEVQSLTIGNEENLITLFLSGPVILFVVHRDCDFPPDIRARISAITEELARLA